MLANALETAGRLCSPEHLLGACCLCAARVKPSPVLLQRATGSMVVTWPSANCTLAPGPLLSMSMLCADALTGEVNALSPPTSLTLGCAAAFAGAGADLGLTLAESPSALLRFGSVRDATKRVVSAMRAFVQPSMAGNRWQHECRVSLCAGKVGRTSGYTSVPSWPAGRAQDIPKGCKYT